MTFAQFVIKPLRLSRNNVEHAALAIAAYLFTSILLIGAIALLAPHTSAERLKAFLTYVLVTTIAAGLEPGTAKSAILTAAGNKDGADLSASLISAGLLKAVLVSPAIGGIWLFSNGRSAMDDGLALVPLITGLGFVATDVRVFLDGKGRYAAAILLKQGSLSIAIACPAVALIFGQSLINGIIAACTLRFIWTVGAIWTSADLSVSRWQKDEFAGHLISKRWVHLFFASALGSLAASIDRLVAFRFLDAQAANAYVFVYEILSKFWLLPYLLAPVVFVKVAQGREVSGFTLKCHLLIAAAGLPLMVLAAALPSVPLEALQFVSHGRLSLVIFAGAIVIASFNQILAMVLQASRNEAAATLSAIVGLSVAAIAFPSLLFLIGFNGIFWAWMLKSLTEFLVLSLVNLRKKRI